MTMCASSNQPYANVEMLDLSVVLPALNEAGNVDPLLAGLKSEFETLKISYEIIVVDGGSRDATAEEARSAGADVFVQKRPGYGGALREGFARVRGRYVLTLDADLSHPPSIFSSLWRERETADVLVASRTVSGGSSAAPIHRRFLSLVLNGIFGGLLRLPVSDSSSGYRLYRREVLRPDTYYPDNFDILQEILVKAFSDGYLVRELPLKYENRGAGASHASAIRFGPGYLATLYRLWKIRHSTNSADYESNAFDSRHLLQRYWQRKRFALILENLQRELPTLDLGSGTSKISQALEHAFPVDLELPKLRYLSRKHKPVVCATAAHLPFANGSFEQAVVSQLLPVVESVDQVMSELRRVVALNGRLVVAVPDSKRLGWKLFGFLYSLLPNVTGNAERNRFSRRDLCDLAANYGFRTVHHSYVLGSELVASFTLIEKE